MKNKNIRLIGGETFKYCRLCEKWKPLNTRYFSISKRHASGFLTYCKKCCLELQRARRAKMSKKRSARTASSQAIAASAEILKNEYWLVNSDKY